MASQTGTTQHIFHFDYLMLGLYRRMKARTSGELEQLQLKCTAPRWHFVIVLTECDLSANKNETRKAAERVPCLSC